MNWSCAVRPILSNASSAEMPGSCTWMRLDAHALGDRLGDTEGVDAPLDDVDGALHGVVQVDVGLLRDVGFEHEACAAAQVEAEAHLTPVQAEGVEALADADAIDDAGFLWPGNPVRQIAVRVGGKEMKTAKVVSRMTNSSRSRVVRSLNLWPLSRSPAMSAESLGNRARDCREDDAVGQLELDAGLAALGHLDVLNGGDEAGCRQHVITGAKVTNLLPVASRSPSGPGRMNMK